ncbi:hypothetical protein GBAR_LOCUS17224, partial [Geodia barretti]
MEILCKGEIEFSYALRISTSAPPTAVDTAVANTGGEGEEEEKAAPSLLLTVCGRLESRALRVLDPLSLSSLPSLSFPPTYYDTTTSRFCLWQSNTRECNTFLGSESEQFNISGVVYAYLESLTRTSLRCLCIRFL